MDRIIINKTERQEGPEMGKSSTARKKEEEETSIIVRVEDNGLLGRV